MEFCSWMCRRQDSGKYVVELMKEGQSRVQVKKRRSECAPELLGTDRSLSDFLNTSNEKWLGVVGRVKVGAVYVGGRGMEADGAGGGVYVDIDMVYGRVGSQGAAHLKIGGTVPFEEVEQVLNVEGGILAYL